MVWVLQRLIHKMIRQRLHERSLPCRMRQVFHRHGYSCDARKSERSRQSSPCTSVARSVTLRSHKKAADDVGTSIGSGWRNDQSSSMPFGCYRANDANDSCEHTQNSNASMMRSSSLSNSFPKPVNTKSSIRSSPSSLISSMIDEQCRMQSSSNTSLSKSLYQSSAGGLFVL